MVVTREICKICCSIIRVGYHVPDKIWQAVIPIEYINNNICLRCFTILADEKFIEWDKNIEFYPVSFYTHVGGINDQES